METLLSQTNRDVLVVYLMDIHLVNRDRVDAVGDALLEAMTRAEHGKLLVNFQVVKSMSSSMLGKLVRLKKRTMESKVALKLSNICPDIEEVFRVMALNKIFDLYDTEADALRAFEREGRFRQ